MSDMKETHDWAKQVSKEFEIMSNTKGADDVKALNNELSHGGDHALRQANFVRVERPSFTGEVGRVEGDLMFHFFPADNDTHSVLIHTGSEILDGEEKKYYRWDFKETFPDALAVAFLEVFKLEEKLCWDFVLEMNSWVVRCTGFGSNIMANQLAEKLFDNLQTRLEQ